MQAPSVLSHAALPLLIGADWLGGAARAIHPLYDPSNGAQIAQAWMADVGDVDAAVAAARLSVEQGVWRALPTDERSRVLWRVAELIDQHKEELARLEMRNTGKTYQSCVSGEIPFAAQCFRYFAGCASKLEGRTLAPSGLPPQQFHAYTRLEPVGVVALIVPWNGPLVQACWKIAPALAAGCSVIVKPSEWTPLTTARLGELMQQAGVPTGVLNILNGDADVGKALAAHPDVDKISFTGSTAVGKHIVQAATGNLKKVTLELGGKSPVLVLDDANLEAAIEGIIGGIFSNAGQVCVAGSRVYVQRGVYETVKRGVCERAAALRVGPGDDPQTQMGPLISAAHLHRVDAMVATARAEGAQVDCGGIVLQRGGGHYYAPTVLSGITPVMQVLREEVFGPVLCLLPFDHPDQLAALANDSPYGLAASIWTRDLGRAHQLAAQVKAGLVWVNCHGIPDMAMPFGGYKQSGWGRENGVEAMLQYLETKSVLVRL